MLHANTPHAVKPRRDPVAAQILRHARTKAAVDGVGIRRSERNPADRSNCFVTRTHGRVQRGTEPKAEHQPGPPQQEPSAAEAEGHEPSTVLDFDDHCRPRCCSRLEVQVVTRRQAHERGPSGLVRLTRSRSEPDFFGCIVGCLDEPGAVRQHC